MQVEQLEDELTPIWDGSTAGGSLTLCATVPVRTLHLFLPVYLREIIS